MTKIITFSRNFPSYHPKAGQPTYFVEKILKSINPSKIQSKLIIQNALNIFSSEIYFSCNPKKHTIRSGNRWKAGDKFSPRVWTDKPYKSKQIILFDDVEIKSVYDFKIINGSWYVNGTSCILQNDNLELMANNDGLSLQDFYGWFKCFPMKKQPDFEGQIICWNDAVSY